MKDHVKHSGGLRNMGREDNAKNVQGRERTSARSMTLLILTIVIFSMALGMFLTSVLFLQRQVVGNLAEISDKLDELTVNVETLRHTTEMLSNVEVMEPTDCSPVMLFYYNEHADSQLSEIPVSDEAAVKPVCRCISSRGELDLIRNTIELLIKGELTDSERSAGFLTEFPGEGFELKDVVLLDGTLKLVFDDPYFFSSGGSARTFMMAAEVRKTALQFSGVEEVYFEPEWVFQP